MTTRAAYPARRTRTGALVVVTDPMTAHDLIGELVDLIAQDGSTAHGRVTAVGRTYLDPTGVARAYAYLDPASITADAA